jgi:phosphohistidine phosphatase SixA
MLTLSRLLPLAVLLAACEAPAVPTGSLPVKGITQVSGDQGRSVRPDKIDVLTGDDLLTALKGGGYVLYFRHFQSDHSVWHEDPIKSKQAEMTVQQIRGTCDQQRPLSEYGRKRARDVGNAMRKLGVPIGSVFSSPYCRVIESARLVAGRPPDETLYDLMHRGGNYTEGMMNRNIRPYLGQIPAKGTNTLLMAHRPQMDSIKFIEEGEAFVFRPKGDERFDLVGTIYDSEWLEALVNPDYLGARATQPGDGAPPRSANPIPTSASADTGSTAVSGPRSGP